MHNVGGIILAAGMSRRMGEQNKLVKKYKGKQLISHVLSSAKGSNLEPLCAVLGHESDKVQSILSEYQVPLVGNPDFASGIASSIRVGLNAMPDHVAGAMILLGDMPLVRSGHIDELIETFNRSGEQKIVRACAGKKQGNPVILPRHLWAEVKKLEGDQGAQQVFATGQHDIEMVDLGSDLQLDFDTVETFEKHQ